MAHCDDVRLLAPRSLLRGFAGPADGEPVEFDLIRPDDQVNLRFTLHGGMVDPVTNVITSLLGEEAIYFSIVFGPQHHVEERIDVGVTPNDEPLASRIAGDTRVVVEVPDGTPFTVASLLDLGGYALKLADKAGLEPQETDTAIEIPAGLVLGPTASSRFTSPTGPRTHDDITERWRARLAPGADDGSGRLVGLYSYPGDPEFTLAVAEADRRNLIAQTQVEPLAVDRLDLSPHGADMHVSGAWGAGQPASYQHRVITGRDLRIEIVDRGYLAPFGHRAVVTSLTERDLVPDKGGDLTAVLTTEEHIDIIAPTVDGAHPYVAHGGRAIPFTRITASEPGAGSIEKRALELAGGGSIAMRRAFLVVRAGEELRIAYTATDHDGNDSITFDLPAVFVNDDVAYEPLARVGRRATTLRRLTTWYEQNPDHADAELGGQPIAWAAAPADLSRGDAGAVQSTLRIGFQLDRPDLGQFDPADVEADLRDLGRPAFAAKVHGATVLDQSGAAVAGGDPPTLDVVIADRYLQHGLGEQNVDLGYLDLEVPSSTAPSTQGDGLLAVGFVVDTFSQLLGGGIEIGDGGVWSPTDALGELSNKLLGLIELTDLIPDITIGGSGNANLPTIEVELIGADDPLSVPTGVCTKLAWEPKVRSVPEDAEKPTFIVVDDFGDAGLDANDLFGNGKTKARLEIETCVPGGVVVDVSLERFAIQLPPGIPVIATVFERVRFVDDSGARSVDTAIADWVFVGALGWLEPVKDLLLGLIDVGQPSFDDGFSLDFDIPIPSIELGLVGVKNINVGLGLDVPQATAARLEFGLSTRAKPFSVTVLGFGGTGHFLVVVDAGDIVLIEGSIGVTYEMSINVFIVAASISITLSAYVRYEKSDGSGEVEFGASVEVAGAVSILGLVKISGSVMVGLRYRTGAKILRGVAAVTGEVSSIFGTSTVTRDVEIEIDLDKSDRAGILSIARVLAEPTDASFTFGDLFSDDEQWAGYCAAFVAA